MWHVDASWPPLEMITFWSHSLDFPHLSGILNLVRQVKVVVFRYFFFLECMKEWHKTWRADVSWPLWNWLHFCHGLLNFFILVRSAPWFRANLTGLWVLKGVRVIKSVDLLDHLYLVISDDIKKANFCIWKLSGFHAGVFPTPVQSDIWSFNYVCIATFVRVEVLRAKV